MRDTGEKPCYTVNHHAGQYLWLYENFTKNSPLYNIPIAKEILGPFEPTRLLAALKNYSSGTVRFAAAIG